MTQLEQATVLVTGAAGFIGSHLVESLVQRGSKVRAFIRYNSLGSCGWLEHVAPAIRENVEIVAGDLRDASRVKVAVSGCDVVFHLGALIAIPYSYHAPDAYVDVNIKGTLNVLQAARESSVKKLVQVSTSEVYGTARRVPISEDHPLQGQSPYSASKIGADQLAYSFFSAFGVPVAIARPFNTYGPRQSARAIIPTIISQIAAGKRRIRLGALHPTRDFTFVADTVDGMQSIAMCEQTIGETVNLGSNFEISMRDVAQVIAELMGVEIEIEQDPDRMRPTLSEVERLFADTSKAQRLMGWTPAHGGLDGFRRGLENSIRWFTDAANLRHYKPDQYSM